ncbi:MAG: OmpH family outer membrane protein [Prevotellaceae bacterium]|jgi:outer membrane protein|nr:OmpH family outer membrane protein [Prevotellaceae bacterium]
MKKILFLVCAAAVCISFQVNAQTFKFGHINGNEIIEILYELDSVPVKLEKTQKDLQEILSEVAAEFEKKSTEFEANQDKWSQVVKESKQAELIDLNRRAQTQQQNAQFKFQQEERRLIGLLQKKLKDAVDKVAKTGGFTYIFDISSGSPIYANETQSTDIGALVRKELGIAK